MPVPVLVVVPVVVASDSASPSAVPVGVAGTGVVPPWSGLLPWSGFVALSGLVALSGRVPRSGLEPFVPGFDDVDEAGRDGLAVAPTGAGVAVTAGVVAAGVVGACPAPSWRTRAG